MAAALLVSLAVQGVFGLDADNPRSFAILLLITTAITTVVWLTVTYATPPESPATLRAFYARVHPGGPGWRAIVPDAPAEGRLGPGLVQWAIGCVVVYLGLFGIGDFVLGRYLRGLTIVVIGAGLTIYLVRATRIMGGPDLATQSPPTVEAPRQSRGAT